jgi:hypothetical protein
VSARTTARRLAGTHLYNFLTKSVVADEPNGRSVEGSDRAGGMGIQVRGFKSELGGKERASGGSNINDFFYTFLNVDGNNVED